MEHFSSEQIQTVVRQDMVTVFQQSPALIRLSDEQQFIRQFLTVWLKVAKKKYTWYDQLHFSLTHSYQTVYVIGHEIASIFAWAQAERSRNPSVRNHPSLYAAT